MGHPEHGESPATVAGRVGTAARGAAEYAARAASMVVRQIAFGIALGVVIGGGAFFAALALDGFEGGWLRWIWLPVYVVLGVVGFAIRGWYRGQARAVAYLLVDGGLVPRIVGGVVQAALAPIAARLGRSAAREPRLWEALQGRMSGELEQTVEAALEQARTQEQQIQDTRSLAARMSARARRTVYGLLSPVLARFIAEAARAEAERATSSDDTDARADQEPPEAVLARMVERVRAGAVERISGWIRGAIDGAFSRPAMIAAAVPVIVFIVVPLLF